MPLRTEFEASLFRAVARKKSIDAKFDLRRINIDIPTIGRADRGQRA